MSVEDENSEAGRGQNSVAALVNKIISYGRPKNGDYIT